MTAGPGTADEQQRLLAQRQREREENDAAWLRYLDTLEPGIRAEQEALRLQRIAEQEAERLRIIAEQEALRLQGLLRCTRNGCIDSTDDDVVIFRNIIVPNISGNLDWDRGGGEATPPFFSNEENILNSEGNSAGLHIRYLARVYDFFDDAEYLAFGAWSNTVAPADRGGFAIGAEFSGALPAAGTATYQGGGGVTVGQAPEDFYSVLSNLMVEFGGDGAHTLSGTLTEVSHTRDGNGVLTLDDSVDPKFILTLGESTFRDGEFLDGKVTCGTGGMCNDDAIDDNFYNAKFFGTAGADGNPTKLGGTFRAEGLMLDGKTRDNVFGGFGGELQ